MSHGPAPGGDLKVALGKDEDMQLGWYQRGGHILCDIARGLHFLHSNKVAHRWASSSTALHRSSILPWFGIQLHLQYLEEKHCLH